MTLFDKSRAANWSVVWHQDTALPRRFEGTRDTMRFVADLPDYLGRGGPHLHELTIDDGPGQPPLVAATLPWQCEGTELRVP